MNRKLILLFSVLLVLTMLLSSSLAISFTFEQVVDMISAAKIDGHQIFTDGVEIDIDRSSTVTGPILLCLLSDQADVSFILPQNNRNEGYMWNVNKKYLNFCMEFLVADSRSRRPLKTQLPASKRHNSRPYSVIMGGHNKAGNH